MGFGVAASGTNEPHEIQRKVKTKYLLSSLMLLLAAATAFMAISCEDGDDIVVDDNGSEVTPPTNDPDPEPDPEPEKPTGTISFTISGEDSVGSGTSSESLVVTLTSDHSTKFVISQQSSYTDPDGSVYTCEPEATIRIGATREAVYASSTEALVAIGESSEFELPGDEGTPLVRSEYPDCEGIGSTYNIGDQHIAFNLYYEIYRHRNSRGEDVEMPYIKFVKSRLVGVEIEEREATRVLKKDTTFYDIKARFEVDAEGVNTAEPINETLTFELIYTGGVVTEVESTHGPTRVYKAEVKGSYLGKEVHLISIDTVYIAK